MLLVEYASTAVDAGIARSFAIAAGAPHVTTASFVLDATRIAEGAANACHFVETVEDARTAKWYVSNARSAQRHHVQRAGDVGIAVNAVQVANVVLQWTLNGKSYVMCVRGARCAPTATAKRAANVKVVNGVHVYATNVCCA